MEDIGLNRVKGYFDEPSHKYSDDDKTNYTSCTTFIHKFEKPFDKDYWSKFKAKERGVSQQVILDEWAGINKQSLDRGNKIHNAFEDGLNKVYVDAAKKEDVLFTGSHSDARYQKPTGITTIIELRNSPAYVAYPKIRAYMEKLIFAGYIIYAEYRLFRPEIQIAGMVDILAIKDNDIIIVDWKTNKKPMLMTSGYYKKKWKDGVKVETNTFVKTLDFMKPPINDIYDCLGMTYTLQLSLYAYMIAMYGFNIKALVLFHIKPERDSVTNSYYDEVTAYPLEYKREAIVKMLKHDNRI